LLRKPLEHIHARSGLSFGYDNFPFNVDGIDGLFVVVTNGLNCFIDLAFFFKEDFAWLSFETFHFFLVFAAE
jgi:hypothetical protein